MIDMSAAHKKSGECLQWHSYGVVPYLDKSDAALSLAVILIAPVLVLVLALLDLYLYIVLLVPLNSWRQAVRKWQKPRFVLLSIVALSERLAVSSVLPSHPSFKL